MLVTVPADASGIRCGGIGGGGDPVDLILTLSDPLPEPPPQYRTLRHITVNEEVIRQPAAAIRLNLPEAPDIVVPRLHWEARAGYIAIYNKDDPDRPIIIPDPDAQPQDFSWRWYGRHGNAVIALTVERGVIAGRVWTGARHYAVRPSHEGTKLGETRSEYWRTHPEDTPRETAVPAPRWSTPAAASPRRSAAGAAGRANVLGGWDTSCTAALTPGPHVIDVLVLYTAGVLQEYGFSHAYAVAQLREKLDDANQALRNSGITSFVYSLRGPEYFTPAFNYDTAFIVDALAELSGVVESDDSPFCTLNTNNYVLGRRNDQWADIVALARRDQSGQGTCGVTFAQNPVSNNGCPREPGPAFERFAYLVFDPECDADRLNFAHELGHQLGMEHDPRNSVALNTPGWDPSCPWSFGHRRADVAANLRFRTVMAYWNDSLPGSQGPDACTSAIDCDVIDAFSTPTLAWTGAGGLQPAPSVPGAPPIGVAPPPPPNWRRADAVDTLQRLAPISAAFRARPDAIFGHGFE